MNRNRLEKFINYGKPLESDAVLYMFCGQIAFALMIFALSYNYILSLSVLLPLTVINAVIYIFFYFLNKRKPSKKHIYLFFGITAITCAVTCQCGCFLITKLTQKQTSTLFIFFTISSLSVYLITIIISVVMIKFADKLSVEGAVSTALIAPFVAIGVITARKFGNNNSKMLIIALSVISLIFLIFFIYIIKYFCIRILEKKK